MTDQNTTGGGTFGDDNATPPSQNSTQGSAPIGNQPIPPSSGAPSGGTPTPPFQTSGQVPTPPPPPPPGGGMPPPPPPPPAGGQDPMQEPPKFDPTTGAPMNASAQAVIAQRAAAQEPPKFDPTTGAPLNASAQAVASGQAAGAPANDDVGRPIGSFGIQGEFKTKVKLPAHQLQFDENKFLQLLAGSISLSKDEKKRIIQAVPKLTQFQVDELMRIFEEEISKFSDLDAKYESQLKTLEGKHTTDWEAIELEYVQEGAAKQEVEDAEAIRKQLGLDEDKKDNA